MANNKRLIQLAGMLSLYPQRHDQGMWFSGVTKTTKVSRFSPGKSGCGTTLCAAGWVSALHAPKKALFVPAAEEFFFVPDETGSVVLSGVNNYEDADNYGHSSESSEASPRYKMVFIPAFAREKLGLTEEQATSLFFDASTLAEVLAVIRAIISNPSIRGEELRGLIEDQQT